jgi:hypothetical protein
MSYVPAIPQPTDKPSVSQGQMLINFTELNTQFTVEHTALTVGGVTQGKHKYITLNRSPAAPAPLGTDLLITQELSNATPFIRALTSGGTSWPFLLTLQVPPVATPAGNNFTNIFNMASYDSTAGFILMWPDAPDNSEMLFTTYTFPHLASPKAGGGQFVPGGGSLMLGITFAGNQLQVHTSGVRNVHTIIGWVAI